MVKHTVILHTGYFFSFDHEKEIDWDNARIIIGCKLIQWVKARWDGENYGMLIDEEALLNDNKKKINHKATFAYQAYWTHYKNLNPDTVFRTKIDDLVIYGNAILTKK